MNTFETSWKDLDQLEYQDAIDAVETETKNECDSLATDITLRLNTPAWVSAYHAAQNNTSIKRQKSIDARAWYSTAVFEFPNHIQFEQIDGDTSWYVTINCRIWGTWQKEITVVLCQKYIDSDGNEKLHMKDAWDDVLQALNNNMQQFTQQDESDTFVVQDHTIWPIHRFPMW